MPNLPLGFAEIALGAILVTAGITNTSVTDVVAGKAKMPVAGKDTLAPGASAVPSASGVSPAQAQAATKYLGALPNAPGSVGFHAQPNTDFTSGQESTIAQRLDKLAKKLKVSIFGISGARTPQHSLDVGGFANDPHTQGLAADIGVNSLLRSSAGFLTEAQLESVGLTRPFAGSAEINHIQLLSGYSGRG